MAESTADTLRILNELRRLDGWNQRDRIAWALQAGVTDCTDRPVVCGSVFLNAFMPRYAVAVSWLRSKGMRIETGYCKTHKLGTYRLTS